MVRFGVFVLCLFGMWIDCPSWRRACLARKLPADAQRQSRSLWVPVFGGRQLARGSSKELIFLRCKLGMDRVHTHPDGFPQKVGSYADPSPYPPHLVKGP